MMTKEQYLQQIDRVIADGKYNADWSSLAGHPTPSWYYRGKLGIFIHWGIYSVPAYGCEWYARAMYDPEAQEFQHHLDTYGAQSTFGYKDYIPLFKAEHFDADRWAALFQESGARFVMPVCEHHDGFAMYNTAFNRWNAVQMGPCRDVTGELKAACERRGLTFCASTHRAEHYFFMNMGRTINSDVNDVRYTDFYGPAFYCPELHGGRLHATTADTFSVGASREFLEDWLVRTCELIDKYQPKILYFDWWIHNHSFKPYLKKLCAYYYNRAEEWGKEVTINFKHKAFPPTVATEDVERGALTDISPLPWQCDTTIGRRSWGYIKDNTYKTPQQIISDLINVVSKNGMLLLNIGPKPDGTITEEETAVLKDIGAWLQKNGEGIYGTTFWEQFGEGETNNEGGFFRDGEALPYTEHDFRFTYKDGCVYAFQMKPSRTVSIKTFRKCKQHDYPIENVTLLGSQTPVQYTRTEEALTITVNEAVGDMPQCFKITIG